MRTPDAFKDAIDAFRGIDLVPNEWGEYPRYVVPSIWTPAHVCVRMIHALDVLRRSERRPGPKGARTSWPEGIGGWQALVDEETQAKVLDFRTREHKRKRQRGPVKIDWRDYVPGDVVREVEADAAEEAMDKADAPFANEIEFAEEAAVWPARYLREKPLSSRALMLFAFCEAFGVKESKALHRERERGKNDVRVLSRKVYDYHRKKAAALLAEKLDRARVAVR